MRIEKIKKAREEAMRFLKTLDALEAAHEEDRKLFEAEKKKAENQRFYTWYHPEIMSSRPDLRGAAKRSSMDLTRELANFRKSQQ